MSSISSLGRWETENHHVAIVLLDTCLDPGPRRPGGPYLDVIVEGFPILLLEFRSNFQHVHFTARDHDSNQHLVASALALKTKCTLQVTIH